MYEDLTDAELDAKIIELRAKVESVTMGGNVVRVAGEGRAVQYSTSNVGDLKTLLTEAVAEKNRRAGSTGRAIGVRF